MKSSYGKLLLTPAVLSGLYLLAVMPRLTGKPDMTPFETKFYAHRGLHDNRSQAPENSMAAFRKAVEAGYGIEMDVQLTADKVPVIFHDFTLNRVCGAEGYVKDYTFEQLQKLNLFMSGEKIPALRDVLEMVDGRVPLIIEYKSNDMDMTICEKVDPMLRAYKGIYCIESFNPLILLWYRRHRPKVMRGQLSDVFYREPEYRPLPKAVQMLPFQFLIGNFLSKPDFIAYNHLYESNLSRRLCRDLYKAKAAAWTIKSRGELAKAKRSFDVFIFDSFLPEGPEGTGSA